MRRAFLEIGEKPGPGGAVREKIKISDVNLS